jgi:hypothetical protein
MFARHHKNLIKRALQIIIEKKKTVHAIPDATKKYSVKLETNGFNNNSRSYPEYQIRTPTCQSDQV